MKIQRIDNKIIIFLNVISLIALLLPSVNLDLFSENYSTLSLSTRGYLYVLFLGIFIGLLLGYETYFIANEKNACLILLSLVIGTIIPHHIPYNIQANIHLLFAYIGFVGLTIATFINIKNLKTRKLYMLMIVFAICIYIKYGMVNTLSEIVVMVSSLLINLYLYI